ncbi:MAG: Holliday junction branch migration protein RuvA [Planctomycetota bacterium]|nr:Holliday junction branch migration protein RuvA [Planctomycetota bacterium]
MYHHLRGKLVETGPMLAVVDVGGTGYELHVPLSTLEALQGRDEVLLYTHLHVREDDLRLFGFSSPAERALFRLVLSVSGVGPAIALAALSTLSPRELADSLAREDTSAIRRIKGVGKRLAERLVVELKDRVPPLPDTGVGEDDAGEDPGRSGAPGAARLADATAALVSLGYSRSEARQRAEAASERLREGGAPLPSVEKLIREALA